MSHLLFYYQRPEPATWVFLSTFLLLGIYFVFHRFFSVRNLDIVLLILLCPGLMMVYEGRRIRIGNQEILETGSLVEGTALRERNRALDNSSPAQLYATWPALTQTSVRSKTNLQADFQKESTSRIDKGKSTKETPYSFVLTKSQVQAGTLAEPANNAYSNDQASDKPSGKWEPEQLEFYGFLFLLIACGLLLIRMLIDPALVRRPLLVPNLSIGGLTFIGISLFLFLMANVITSSPREQQVRGPTLGPGYALLNMLPQLPTTPDQSAAPGEWQEPQEVDRVLPIISRILATLSNLAIILGIVGVGYWHFDNVKTGIGCAVMYLLLPYTAQMTGNLEHVVPAALMVLGLLAYRQPMIAGVLMGLAAGLVYYPMFLLPLWLSFYWHRGLAPWLWGFVASLVLLAGLLLLQGWEAFGDHLRQMFGLWLPRMEGLVGIWAPGRFQADFRLPVLVAFILLSLSFALWPGRKNLGTLMCGTAAVMLAAQFWHGNGGGLFMAWFLPFVLLTVFRPNLDDRIATLVVGRRATRAPS